MTNDSITTLRFWALVVVRTIGAGMMVYGGVCFLLGAGIGVANYAGISGLYYGMFLVYGSDSWSWLWFGIALLIVGGIVTFLSRRLVRWIIPVPRRECAQCGYELSDLKSPKCPECGFTFAVANPTERS